MENTHINCSNNEFNSDEEVINTILKKNNENLKKQKKICNIDIKNIDTNENYKELKKEFNIFLENVLMSTTKINNIIKKIDKQIQKNDNIKEKQQKNKNENEAKGFAEDKLVPKSIQKFFNLEEGIKKSRTQIGGLFQEYLKNNNLKGNINEKNKVDNRIYKLDDKLSKLFNITEEQKNKINSCLSSKMKYPDGYNFYNYQTWIKKLYEEENLRNNIEKDDILYTKII